MQVLKDDPAFLGDEQIHLKLKHCKDLPSPPGIASRILDLSEDEQASFADVADIISIDPALTAKVLRIANSPLYAKQRKIENLRQAIMVLGLNSTMMLALSFSMVSGLEDKSATRLDHNLFWRRSLEAACACRLLGKQLGCKNTEDFFLAGLLSDVGMLALDKIMPDLYSSIANFQSSHPALIASEQAALGSDHACVGAWLLDHWKLPQRWVTAVAASHDPEAVDVDDEYLQLAQCTALASEIAGLSSAGDAMVSMLADIADHASRWLKLDKAAIGDILECLTEEISQFASLFNIDLGDTALLTALMDEAREQLMTRSLKQLHDTDRLQQTTQALETRTRELEVQSRRDGLTGIYNRAYVDAVLQQEFAAAKTHGWPIALMFIDLDHFKEVNDNYGHQAGDLVLRNSARLLMEVARETDIVARFGGEEFLIILPGTGTTGATAASERLLEAFRNAKHSVNGSDGIVVTCSIGIGVQGEAQDFEDPDALVGAADRALYAAKFAGRDQAMIFNENLSPLG